MGTAAARIVLDPRYVPWFGAMARVARLLSVAVYTLLRCGVKAAGSCLGVRPSSIQKKGYCYGIR